MNPRKLEWTIVGAAIVLSLFAGTYRGREARAGDTLVVDFSLVPSDRGNLACAAPPFNRDANCSLSTSRGPENPNPRNVVPVMSTARELYLAKALFETSGFLKKSKENRAKNQRFSLRCQVTLERKIANAEVQFERGGAFGPAKDVWLLDVKSCR